MDKATLWMGSRTPEDWPEALDTIGGLLAEHLRATTEAPLPERMQMLLAQLDMAHGRGVPVSPASIKRLDRP
jgi:hypothetical protein